MGVGVEEVGGEQFLIFVGDLPFEDVLVEVGEEIGEVVVEVVVEELFEEAHLELGEDVDVALLADLRLDVELRSR